LRATAHKMPGITVNHLMFDETTLLLLGVAKLKSRARFGGLGSHGQEELGFDGLQRLVGWSSVSASNFMQEEVGAEHQIQPQTSMPQA